MKRTKIIALVVSVVMLMALLAGCGGSSAPASDGGSSGSSAPASGSSSSSGSSAPAPAANPTKKQLNVAADLFSQPNIHDLNASWFVIRIGVAECLVKDGDDGSFQPWLAESWELADDNLTWTFHLRSGVKFSNGADMTATKVKESIEWLYEVQDPANGGVGDIQGFMKFTSISADDAAGTVTIVTEKPQADMPGVMAYPLMAIIDAEATRTRDMLLDGPVCTGPYAIESYTDGHDFQLVANPNYWGGQVPFEKVSFVKVAEANARLNALLDGSADVATHIQASDLSMLEASGYNISNVAGARDGYYHINFDGPLGNDTLRKAVHMAIDDETIASITTGGSYTAGHTPLSPVFSAWGGASIPDNSAYDPEGAMKLLDDAGIKDTNGDGWRELDGKEFQLVYITQSNRQMADIAQAHAELIKEIGVNCAVQIVDGQHDYMTNGNFDFVSSNEMVMPTGDPKNFLSHWYSKAGTGYNYSRYANPEYDALYEQLEVEMDKGKRDELIAAMNKILTEDNAMMLGGYYNFNICSSTDVVGAYNPTCDFYWVTFDIKPAV